MPLLPMLDMPGISPFVATSNAQAPGTITGLRATSLLAGGQDEARTGQYFHEMFVASAAATPVAPGATLAGSRVRDITVAEQPSGMVNVQAGALLRMNNVPAAITAEADIAAGAPLPHVVAWRQETAPDMSTVPVGNGSPVEVAAQSVVASAGGRQARVAPQPSAPVRPAQAKTSAAGPLVIRNQSVPTAADVAVMPIAESTTVVTVPPTSARATAPLPSALGKSVTDTVAKAAAVISNQAGPAVSARSTTTNPPVALTSVVAARKAESAGPTVPAAALLAATGNRMQPAPAPATVVPIAQAEVPQSPADRAPRLPQDHELVDAVPLVQVAQEASTVVRDVAAMVSAHSRIVIGSGSATSAHGASPQVRTSSVPMPAASTPSSRAFFDASLSQTVPAILPEPITHAGPAMAEGQSISPTIQPAAATAPALASAASIIGSITNTAVTTNIGVLSSPALVSVTPYPQVSAVPPLQSGEVTLPPEPISRMVPSRVVADRAAHIPDLANADVLPTPVPTGDVAGATEAAHAPLIVAPTLDPTSSAPGPVTSTAAHFEATISSPALSSPNGPAVEISPRHGISAALLPELVSTATPREPAEAAARVEAKIPPHVGFASSVIAGARVADASDGPAASLAVSPALVTEHIEPTTNGNLPFGNTAAVDAAINTEPQGKPIDAARALKIDATPQAPTASPSLFAAQDASAVSVAVRAGAAAPADLKEAARPSRSAPSISSPQPAFASTPVQASVAGQPVQTTRISTEPAAHEDVATALSSAAIAGHSATAVSVPEAASVPHVLPQSLEIGVAGGTHGWLKVRAEMGSDGQVSASVVTTSASSGDSLRAQLPEMREFLGAEKVSVGSLAVHVAEPDARAITLAKGETTDLLQLSSRVAATAGTGAAASQTGFDNHTDSSAGASMMSGNEYASANDQGSRRDGSGPQPSMTAPVAGIDARTVDAQANLLASMLVEQSGSRLSVRV